LGCPLFVTISGRLASIIWLTKDATSGAGRMSARTAARLGWFLFVASVLLFVSALVLNLRRPQYPDLAFTTGELVLALALLLFGWFGALVVSRQPNQPIGWVLCAFGVLGGVGSFASEYAIYGLRSHPGAVPEAAALAWFASWAFALELALLTALLLLFPSGRPPSLRWRWVLWLAGIGAGLSVVGALAMWPRRGIELLQVSEDPEPVGRLAIVYDVGFWVSLAAVLAAIVSLVVRFRRARGVERQQLKWVVYAVVVVVVCFILFFTAPHPILSELVADVVFALLITLIPVAMGAAILKYRLYDIDRLINRTLVYGLLTALLGAIYASLVLVLGQLSGGLGTAPPSWAVAGATLAVAALFQPARRRIQAVVDRRFNRRKYDAAKTVEAFSARLRDEVDLDALAAELLAIADQTMQPTRASLWLRPATQARSRGR
jgi:MFS family permease